MLRESMSRTQARADWAQALQESTSKRAGQRTCSFLASRLALRPSTSLAPIPVYHSCTHSKACQRIAASEQQPKHRNQCPGKLASIRSQAG